MNHQECIDRIAEKLSEVGDAYPDLNARKTLADAARTCLEFLSEGEYHDADAERMDILWRLEVVLSKMCGLRRQSERWVVDTLAIYAAPAYAAPTLGGAVPDSFEEGYDRDVVLKAVGPTPIEVVRVLRELFHEPLKDTLNSVRALRDGGPPLVVRRGVPKYDAEEMRKALEKVGALIELVPR